MWAETLVVLLALMAIPPPLSRAHRYQCPCRLQGCGTQTPAYPTSWRPRSFSSPGDLLLTVLPWAHVPLPPC